MSFTLYTVGLKYMEAGRAAVLATLEPIVTTLVGVVVYKEMLSLVMVCGIAMVLGASILISKE
jgi:drug/metabolite transporter (DMT)-like permease